MKRAAIYLLSAILSLATVGVTPYANPSVVKSAGGALSSSEPARREPTAGTPSEKKSASAEESATKVSLSKASSENSSWTESAAKKSVGRLILEGARKEVANGTRYHGHGYYEISYPNGDISRDIGVCTDLLVRAFRNAGIDLQKLLHEDRAKNPQHYPTHLWEVKKADPNIDHRRCQNLCMFFEKFARKCPDDFGGAKTNEWRGGDVVFFKWEYEKFPWHCAIVSDARTPDGFPMIVHLFPENAKEESIEKYLPIHSHYRWERPSGSRQ